jgi:hypothetical protein
MQTSCEIDHQRLNEQIVEQQRKSQTHEPIAHKGRATLVTIDSRKF